MTPSDIRREGPAGRYEIRQKVGEGGAGAVYKAWDTQLQRFVAFKRLKLQDLGDHADLMFKEAKALASIQHPNILTIFDCGEDELSPYVVTEYLEGHPLDRLIPRVRFDANTIGELITQTLEGLIAAHHMHIIHRDIKPSNIMAVSLPSGARQYKILDFGLARILTQPTVQTMYDHNSIFGTVYCLAPEQIRHQPLDERTDIYAMGCVYYFMLTGQSAFQGESIVDVIAAHIEHRFTPLKELRPDLPGKLCEWVERLISLDPSDRPSSAKAALDEFHRIQQLSVRGGTIRVTPSDAVKAQEPTLRAFGQAMGEATKGITIMPDEKRPRRRHALAAAMLAVGISVAGVVILQTRESDSDIATESIPGREQPDASLAALAVPAVEPPATSMDVREYFAHMERADLLYDYFTQLKDLHYNYGSLGHVGEALLLVTLRNQYADDPNIECLAGLHYRGADGSTAGELDVVIWRRDTRQAIAVYEVKVSDNHPNTLRQARSQLRRFQNHVESRAITGFNYPLNDSRLFTTEQFDNVESFVAAGSQGAAEVGYDIELDITRAEAVQLQQVLRLYRRDRRPTPGAGYRDWRPVSRFAYVPQISPPGFSPALQLLAFDFRISRPATAYCPDPVCACFTHPAPMRFTSGRTPAISSAA